MSQSRNRRRREVPTCRVPRRLGVEALERRSLLAMFMVTDAADDGTAASLRGAIMASNAANGTPSVPNIIDFAIPGTGIHTITLSSSLGALPAITQAVSIIGASQPVYTNSPLIEIDGANLSTSVGLEINSGAAGCIVDGLSIVGFDSGIELENTQDLVEQNYIGLTASGSVQANVNGILIEGSSGHVIGGPLAGEGNVISGNMYGIEFSNVGTSDTVVEGNLIGVAPDGMTAAPNGYGITDIGTVSGNTIGGTTVVDRNVISDNTSDGILISGQIGDNSTGNVVEGNYIGVAADGMTAAANISFGVAVASSSVDNTIGGTIAGSANVISGNGQGVLIIGTGTTNNVVQGNLIGLGADGTTAVPNGIGVGIFTAADGNTIGGTTASARNVISGNTAIGMEITGNGGVGPSGNVVEGNYIGLAADGMTIRANKVGVKLSMTAMDNTIGGTTSTASNTISGNSSEGVFITDTLTTGNVVDGNIIGFTAGGTAAGNINDGITITAGAADNTIGGTGGSSGNIIGSSNVGIDLSSTSTTYNVVEGDFVGLTVGGAAFPNGTGVFVQSGASSNIIGGTAVGSLNVISGNTNYGIDIADPTTTDDLVEGNYIGTAADGITKVPNGSGTTGAGILIGNLSAGNTIGGTVFAAQNVISGNSIGVVITGDASNNAVEGDYIGLGTDGSTPAANGVGVQIDTGSNGNTIGGLVSGAGDVISDNTIVGILIEDNNTTGNLVARDIIGLESDGATVAGNAIGVELAVLANHDTIGGTNASGRNVISGNGRGIVLSNISNGLDPIEENYIGLNAAGTAAAGNGTGIQLGLDSSDVSAGNLIGGTAVGGGNTISGNTGNGIDLAFGQDDLIEGNIIGLAAGGDMAIPNAIGVNVQSLYGAATIGGTVSSLLNVISGNTGDGVQISSQNDVVEGNNIGTNALGQAAEGNGGAGVDIDSVSLIGGNIIGGMAAGAGNVISGNAKDGVYIFSSTQNVVQGNKIGLAQNGLAAIANTGSGVFIVAGINSGGNTIGGTVGNAGNVISGNTVAGISDASTTGDLIEGNLIGTGSTGTTAIANPTGILLNGIDADVTIGGTAAAARNLISGNSIGIDIVSGEADQILGNVIGMDTTGTMKLPNVTGIQLATGSNANVVGGTASGSSNLIAGNIDFGILILGSGAKRNLVEGNTIGLATAGNGAGVFIQSGANANTIGGITASARNVISGNLSDGVILSNAGTSNNVVEGNDIGSDSTGLIGVGNGPDDILINSGATNNTIGGTTTIGSATAGARNLIVSSTDGVEINGTGTTGNVVEGNYIGLGSDGLKALGNKSDVVIDNGAAMNTIGGLATFGSSPTPGGGNVIGPASLEAIDLQSGSGNVVEGNIVGLAADGSTSFLNTKGILVEMNATNDTIGGLITGAGNVISGNSSGIEAVSSSGLLVAGNFLGLKSNLQASAGGANYGLLLDSGTANITVGGTTAGSGNFISGNNVGVEINAPGALVEGNTIGLTADGSTPVANSYGIALNSGASNDTIGGATSGAGNVISGNSVDGIEVVTGSNLTIQGNTIGLTGNGLAVRSNPGGIVLGVGTSSTTTGDTIGGAVAGAGNIIAGNTTGILAAYTSNDLIEGNLIGLTRTNTIPVGNAKGILIANNSGSITIGGTTPAAQNVISGNSTVGLQITGGSGDLIEGNLIGLKVDGMTPSANPTGVMISGSATNVTIGGIVTGAENVISANTVAGVDIEGGSLDLVEGNFIGILATGFEPPAGSAQAGNLVGIKLGSATTRDTIGGTIAGSFNLISGNGTGISISGTGTSLISVAGNVIGLAGDGLTAASNGLGVQILGGASAITIGPGNIISGSGDGIDVGPASNILIVGNYFGTSLIGTADPSLQMGLVDVKILAGSSNVTIGGIAAGSRNIIDHGGIGVDDEGGSNDSIVGNYIGLAADGLTAIGNNIGVVLGAGASGDTVGGTALGAGNVISGNIGAGISQASTSSNLVIGNIIGLAANGSTVVGNGTGFILGAGMSNVTIGGSASGAGNVISGNTTGIVISGGTNIALIGLLIGVSASDQSEVGNGVGISITNATNVTIGGTTASARDVIEGGAGGAAVSIQGGSNIVVEGDYIGVGTDGTTALGKGTGIVVSSSSNVTIGGTSSAARDIISGNVGNGVFITGATTTGVVVEGDYIGLALDGLTKVGNGAGSGVTIDPGPSGNTIGGTTPGSRNVISGNAGAGVVLTGAGTSNNVVEGNFIGVAADGKLPVGNGTGVLVSAGASSNLIGGLLGFGNVISGNLGVGVYLTGAGTSGNTVEGNVIGLDSSTTNAVSNIGDGVRVDANATNDAIGGTAAGTSNVIGFNGGAGVAVAGSATTGILIVGNLMYANTGTGIVLSGGANPGAPTPLLLGATTSGSTQLVTGSVAGTPGAQFLISLYANTGLDATKVSEGRNFLGFQLVQIGSNGQAIFQISISPAQGFFTATASNSAGDTSMFSSSLLPTDLTISQSTSPSAILAGSPFSFQLNVGNSGPYAASNLIVTDVVPPALSAGPDSVTVPGVSGYQFAFSAGILTVFLPSLPVGGSVQIIVHFASAPAGILLSNSASVNLASGVANINPIDNVSTFQAFVAPISTAVRPTYVIGPAKTVSADVIKLAFQIDGVIQSPLLVIAGSPLTINGAGNNDLFEVDLGTPDNALGLPTETPVTISPGGSGSQFVFDSIPDVPGLAVLVAGLNSSDGLFFPNPVASKQEVFASVNPALGQTQISIGASGSSPPISTDIPFAFQGSPVVEPITSPGGVGLVGGVGINQIGVTGTGSGQFSASFNTGQATLNFVAPTVTLTGRGDTHSYQVAPLPGGNPGLDVNIVGQNASTDQLIIANQDKKAANINLQDGPLAPGSLNYTGIASIMLAKVSGGSTDSLTYSELNPSSMVHVAVGQASTQVVDDVPGSLPLTILGAAVGNNLEVDSMAAGQTTFVNVNTLPPKTLHGLSVIGLPGDPGVLRLVTNRSTEQVIFEPYPQYNSGVFVITTRTGRVYSVAYTNMIPYLNGVMEKVPAAKKATKKAAVKIHTTSVKQTPSGPASAKKTKSVAKSAKR